MAQIKLLHQSLGFHRHPLLEKVVEPVGLRPRHHVFGPEAAVTTQHSWPQSSGDLLQPVEQIAAGRGRGMLVTSVEADLQDQTRLGQHEGMECMRWPPRLVRVVPDDRSLLVAIQRLHRDIDVEDPRQRQERRHRLQQMALGPESCRLGIHATQSSTNGILARHPPHAQQLRIHAVAAQGGDVGIAPMAIHRAEQPGSQDVADVMGPIALVAQRAIGHPSVEDLRRLQELGEMNHPAIGAHPAIAVPSDVEQTAGGLDWKRVVLAARAAAKRITCLVTRRGQGWWRQHAYSQSLPASQPSGYRRV